MKCEELYENLYNELVLNINCNVLKNECLKKHTYFKIGGPAALFLEPSSISELAIIFDKIRKYKANYYIIGNGTNLLVSDDGFDGIIIKMGDKFNYINENNNKLTVGAGTLLSVISKYAAKISLTGLEFASGIPGYIGGAVCMNAGAYNGEMKDIISKVKCVDTKGNIYEFNNDEMMFGYRRSKITDENLIVVEAEITLQNGNQEAIYSYMKDLNEKRISKQPINMPSAGSTFKRPKDGYASKLIEDAGLKGIVYGDAMVSDKHSGFIVNCGNATCSDVLELMRIVISVVKEKYDVLLEPEIKIIGTSL